MRRLRLANSAISRRVTLGDSNASPRATARTPRSSSTGSVSLTRKPLAPMRIASKTYSSRSNVVRMMTRDAASAASAAIARVASSPSSVGHPDVHQHDVRTGRAYDRDGLASVRGLADDLDVVLGVEQRAQPGPQQCLVVGQHDPDHALPLPAAGWRPPCVPPEGDAPMVSVPPSATARSRMPRMPLPSSNEPMPAPPVPSSATSHGSARLRHSRAGCPRAAHRRAARRW